MSPIGVLCPGQGGQDPAMLDLALSSAAGARAVAEAEQALATDLVATVRGGGAALFRNDVAQPLVVAAQAATWAALREELPEPVVLAGYSLGELSAHACAGALSLLDAVRLAERRAALMDAASPGATGLTALRGLPLFRIEDVAAAAGAEVAIVNGPDHAVAGGPLPALAEVERRALAAGATTVRRLPIGVAAHTRFLAAAVAPFAELLRDSPIAAPEVPVLAGVDGDPVRSRDGAVSALSRQLATRIEWSRCVLTAAEMGATTFLELGPGAALSRMVQELVPAARVRSVTEFRSVAGIVRWARG